MIPQTVLGVKLTLTLPFCDLGIKSSNPVLPEELGKFSPGLKRVEIVRFCLFSTDFSNGHRDLNRAAWSDRFIGNIGET